MAGAAKGTDYYGQMSESIKEAAQMQADSADKAMQIAQEQFNKSLSFLNKQYALARSDLAPFVNMGNQAMNEMYDLMGLSKPATYTMEQYNAADSVVQGLEGSITEHEKAIQDLADPNSTQGGWEDQQIAIHRLEISRAKQILFSPSRIGN